MLKDISVFFIHKDKKYPLFELFNVNEHNKKEDKKKENMKVNKRKSKTYIFNTHLCNDAMTSFKSVSSIKNVPGNMNNITDNMKNDNYNNIYKNNEKNVENGKKCSKYVESRNLVEINNRHNEYSKEKKNITNIKNDNINNNENNNYDNNINNKEEYAISLLTFTKYETTQAKTFIKFNKNILITLSVKEIYNILNMNCDYKPVDLEKKLKSYKILFYYYLLGKKYCKELYMASDKNFEDMNIHFMHNIYFNIIINKKYNLLFKMKKGLVNSFFFTKMYLHCDLKKLTMITDHNDMQQNMDNKLVDQYTEQMKENSSYQNSQSCSNTSSVGFTNEDPTKRRNKEKNNLNININLNLSTNDDVIINKNEEKENENKESNRTEHIKRDNSIHSNDNCSIGTHSELFKKFGI